MNQLAELLILYLTTPSSNFYLPKILGGAKDPTLEPYRIDRLSAGSVTVLDQELDIALEQVDIRGISNVQIAKTDNQARVDVVGNTVTFHAVRPNTEAPPANVPTELVIDAQLEITAGGAPSPAVPVTVTIECATLTGAFTATGDPARSETIDITFTSAVVAATATSENIQFDLSQFDSFLRPQVESYLKEASTLASLIDRVNAELAKPSILAALGKSGTDAARSALGQLTSGG